MSAETKKHYHKSPITQEKISRMDNSSVWIKEIILDRDVESVIATYKSMQDDEESLPCDNAAIYSHGNNRTLMIFGVSFEFFKTKKEAEDVFSEIIARLYELFPDLTDIEVEVSNLKVELDWTKYFL